MDAQRIPELERKVGQRGMEIDFLKKVLRGFTERALPRVSNGGTEIREAEKAEAAVNRLCQAAGVGRAGSYRFLLQAEAQPADIELRSEIQQVALQWGLDFGDFA